MSKLTRCNSIILTAIFSLAILSGCSRTDSDKQPDVAIDDTKSASNKTPVLMPATNPLRDAYFGETHMHTAFSLDAYIGGARRSATSRRCPGHYPGTCLDVADLV